MGRELNGSELAGFIKERQAYQVRNLRQEHGIIPKLLILMAAGANDVIRKYVELKCSYARDILVEVETRSCREDEMPAVISAANENPDIHGIIVQLPLDDDTRTDGIVALIASEKDVDGLGPEARYISATATAIDWLLSGYNIELKDKKIAIIGRGRLVGAPLAALWQSRGHTVTSLDVHSKDTARVLRRSGVIVSAAGVPRLVTGENISKNAVVVDAGTASENGVIHGDVDDGVRSRRDISITPKIGGVGPMTVAVMFDHVIQAALRCAGKL